ncbi:MAG: tRNA pseudouridine(13) synthase TruD [Moraxellaceae bacterium]|nr:tRNA pseudouridine(13) synthase TruD [Moraxellaceae bacterium]
MNWSPFLLENLPFAHGAPLGQATLRAVPEDFQVDEISGFEPSGEGEHLFLHIRKRNQNTSWVASQIARAIGLSEDLVSYAGMKDRRAVTTQWFSVHIPNRQMPDLSAVWTDEIELLSHTWNARKLKRGAHQGNRFMITLRDVDGDRKTLEQRLATIAEQGVPNYIGPQRFGINGGNLPAGAALLASKPKRRLNHRESLGVSAVRSALFNKVLAERIQLNAWAIQLPGDVLQLDGRNSFFCPDADDAALPERLARQEIHPTGPFFGAGTSPVTDDVLALENTVAEQAEGLVERLARFGLDNQRRSLRLHVRELVSEWLEEGSLRLTFALPSGAFATSVLRELVQLRESADALPVE